jgi:hypothetical protein
VTPSGREGSERPREFKKIYEKRYQTGIQEFCDCELRKYEEGHDNDTENADIYEEWINSKFSRILTFLMVCRSTSAISL